VRVLADHANRFDGASPKTSSVLEFPVLEVLATLPRERIDDKVGDTTLRELVAKVEKVTPYQPIRSQAQILLKD
jgi:hypothetical protein